jgi:hypothetical protein
VKRFVFTSSSSAAVISDPAAPAVEVTEDTWNEAAVKAAWAQDPPHAENRGLVVYAASKTESEKAVWKFHRENRDRRPDLVVNTGELCSWPIGVICLGPLRTEILTFVQFYPTQTSASLLTQSTRVILAALVYSSHSGRDRCYLSTRRWRLVRSYPYSKWKKKKRKKKIEHILFN